MKAVCILLLYCILQCNSFILKSQSITNHYNSRRFSIEKDIIADMLNNKKLIKKVIGKQSETIKNNIKSKAFDDDDKESLAMDVFNILLDKFSDLTSLDSDDDEDDDYDDDDNDNDNNINDRSNLFDGVIRVYCTHSQPSFSMPWQRQKQEFSTSTGFVIDGDGDGNSNGNGKRILTNAHAVEYGSLIQVKKRQSEKKYVASVVAVGHECDLAILSVEDATFWEGLEPLKFGNIPELLEDVSVIGFPVGGDSLSITSGVVSRIEMQEYAQASAELLAIQIDAAINPGNSGGPVVNMEDEVIGVAFQSLSEEDIENIGYVVPVNVINHFLDDVKKNGRYSGVCGMGIKLQNMENEDLRKYYNMSAEQTGILVSGTAKLAPVSSLVFKGDVILSLDGIRVANDGTIPFRQTKSGFKERVQINYYFTQLFPSDQVKVEILRQGQRMVVDVPVWVPQALIPRILLSKNIVDTEKSKGTGSNGSIVGGTPSYLIVGGLVFVPLSKEYLASEYNTEHMGDFESWAEDYRILSLADQMKREEEEEVVLLSQVIAHTCNIGYETHRNMQLVSLNGNAIKNLKGLKHLVDSFLETTTRPLLFEFANGQIIVIDSNAGKVAQTQICQEHFIPHPCSDDLLL